MTTLREAAQQALEALEARAVNRYFEHLGETIAALKAALEQPEPWVKSYCGGKPNYTTPAEQEPVAWMYKGIKSDGTEHGPHLVWVPAYMDAMSAEKGAVASPLYTHPPRRESEPAAFDALVAISLLTHLGGEVAEYADVVEAVRRLHALNGELLEVLKHYADTYCEGWCKESCGSFNDCGGCKARATIAKAEGKV
jgi:hypothetical protein